MLGVMTVPYFSKIGPVYARILVEKDALIAHLHIHLRHQIHLRAAILLQPAAVTLILLIRVLTMAVLLRDSQ